MKRERLLVLLESGEPYSQPEPALARTVFLARETNATLELFLSEDSPSGPSIGQASLRDSSACADLRGTQATLEAIADRLVNGERLTVATEVISSRDPIEAIMEKVRQMRPDMVVKTRRHDSTLTRTLFNSTDWRLIRSCPCPLMLVKEHEVWETRRIIACVDPAHIHRHAETLDDVIIEAAQMLAYRLRGEIHVFHSIEILPEPVFRFLHLESSYADYERTTAEEHEDLVEDLIRRFGIGYSRVHYAVGRPAETLPAFASAMQASLIVIGAVVKGALELLFIGNTAEKVLDDLNCDVFVVKSNPVGDGVPWSGEGSSRVRSRGAIRRAHGASKSMMVDKTRAWFTWWYAAPHISEPRGQHCVLNETCEADSCNNDDQYSVPVRRIPHQ